MKCPRSCLPGTKVVLEINIKSLSFHARKGDESDQTKDEENGGDKKGPFRRNRQLIGSRKESNRQERGIRADTAFK